MGAFLDFTLEAVNSVRDNLRGPAILNVIAYQRLLGYFVRLDLPLASQY